MNVDNDSATAGDWRAAIRELASFERPSASDGERRAADLIASRLRALGCKTTVEEERAHGGYWWPIGLVNAAAVAGAVTTLLHRRVATRALTAAVAGIGAAALWDDLGHGRRWFRRTLLPHRPTWNVVAEVGEADAERTVVFIAHHDAAHSGLIFHPILPRIPLKVAPRLHARSNRSFPLLYAVWLGPVLVCAGSVLGARRLLAAGRRDRGRSHGGDGGHRGTCVGTRSQRQLERGWSARRARRGAYATGRSKGVRVLLVSTGSEESFSEGMQGFGHRHFSELDPERTEMVCLECVGGPTLIVVEGEGMLRMRDYPAEMREALDEAAAAARIPIVRGLRTTAATDAIIALRAGYPVATLASVDETKLPMNYHWPNDVPDALHWDTIEDAVGVCEQFLRTRVR